MAKPNVKRLVAAAIFIVAAAGGGAFGVHYRNQMRDLPVTPDQSAVTLEGDWGVEKPTEPPTEFEPPSYPSVPLKISPVIPTETELRIEAEDTDYTGELTVEKKRKNYSGSGYLTGFSKRASDSVKAEFEVPASQHYNITISVCADQPVTNALLLNGEKLGDFKITESEHFTRVTFSGIYLAEGTAVLSIEETDGYFALDYFEIEDFPEMYGFTYNDSYTLCDPSASKGAKSLMQFLTDNYGKRSFPGSTLPAAATPNRS